MKLKLPEETIDIFHEYCGLLECRDKSIKSLFAYKRAGYYGKIAHKKRLEFWRSVKTVYPEHKDKAMNFDIEDEVLTVIFICSATVSANLINSLSYALDISGNRLPFSLSCLPIKGLLYDKLIWSFTGRLLPSYFEELNNMITHSSVL